MPSHQSNSSRFTRDSKRRRYERAAGAAVAVIAGVLLLIATLVAVRRVIAILGTPLLRTGAVLKEVDLLTATRDTLVAHVRSLMAQNEELTSRAAQLSVLERENDNLRELLGIRTEDEVFSAAASVVVRPPDSPYGLMVVDAGSRDGVFVGDIVRIAGREHIGEVVAITETTAKVLLYSAPDSEHAVYVGNDETSLTAVGFSGSWRIEAPQELLVAVGDDVVLQGSERVVLGYVRTIDNRGGEPFKYVYVSPSVSIQELSWVDIVRFESQ